jgi:7-cyano-7-deazaguanine synthase
MLLLFSGGLDSYIAWNYLGRPDTIYFDLGHRYCAHELERVKYLAPKTKIVTNINLAEHEKKDADIPMRNAFLLMFASYYDTELALIVQRGEMTIPDRSPKFFEDFGKWLSFLNNQPITIMSPFFDMTKTQMVKWYVETGLSKEDLLYTRSCYSPGELPCGACSACFRRWVALTNNRLSEKYQNNIFGYKEITRYIREMKEGKYDPLRSEETFDALMKSGYNLI